MEALIPYWMVEVAFVVRDEAYGSVAGAVHRTAKKPQPFGQGFRKHAKISSL
jgi:hypothetical protein